MQLHEPVHVLHDPVRILTQAVLRHARSDDLVMMECHAVGGDAPGGRLADVVQEPGQAEHGVGLEPLDRGERVAQHVLVSVDGVLLEAQGRHLRDEPVRQARLDEQGQPRREPPRRAACRARRGCAPARRCRRSRIRPIASTTRGAGETPSCDTKRAARTMRRRIVRERDLGIERRVEPLRREVLHALERVHERPSGSRIAIALIVKSRRERSVPMSLAVTAGFRSSSG